MNNNFLMSSMLFFSMIQLPLFLLIVLFKIKIFRGRRIRERLGFDALLLALIYFLNPDIVFVYLGIYIFAELLYYFFSKYTNLKVLDRVLISSALGTLFIYVFYNIYSLDLYQTLTAAWNSSQEQTSNFYKTVLKISGRELENFMSAMTATFNETLTYMKENFLFISFVTLFLINYLINFMYRQQSSKKWEMSYFGLLVYIIPVFIMKITGKSSFLLENLVMVGQFIYIIYGIKAIYKLLSKKVNAKIYTRILSISAAIIFPKILFLIGAFRSFNIKIKIVRK